MVGLAWLRWGLTALCCVPAATFVAEVLVGAPPPRRRRTPASVRLPRTVILVPAHNERAVITATLDNLRGELTDQVSLLVVADNCEDDTPELAERAGARVIRRRDPTRRGKGYAINVMKVINSDAQLREKAGRLATLYTEMKSVQERYIEVRGTARQVRGPRWSFAGE